MIFCCLNALMLPHFGAFNPGLTRPLDPGWYRTCGFGEVTKPILNSSGQNKMKVIDSAKRICAIQAKITSACPVCCVVDECIWQWPDLTNDRWLRTKIVTQSGRKCQAMPVLTYTRSSVTIAQWTRHRRRRRRQDRSANVHKRLNKRNYRQLTCCHLTPRQQE